MHGKELVKTLKVIRKLFCNVFNSVHWQLYPYVYLSTYMWYSKRILNIHRLRKLSHHSCSIVLFSHRLSRVGHKKAKNTFLFKYFEFCKNMLKQTPLLLRSLINIPISVYPKKSISGIIRTIRLKTESNLDNKTSIFSAYEYGNSIKGWAYCFQFPIMNGDSKTFTFGYLNLSIYLIVRLEKK